MGSNIVILIIVIVIIILLVSNSVKVYTMEGYNDNTTNGNSQSMPKLVLYHTQWCGFSKRFMPDWQSIKNTTDNVIFEEYDCDKDKEQCSAQNIVGYPSLILFKPDGTKVVCPDNLPRNQDNVKQFIQTNSN